MLSRTRTTAPENTDNQKYTTDTKKGFLESGEIGFEISFNNPRPAPQNTQRGPQTATGHMHEVYSSTFIL